MTAPMYFMYDGVFMIFYQPDAQGFIFLEYF